MKPFVVYGATGFTGRLVCAALDADGQAFVAAGRDGDKLRALASSLRGRPETVKVGVDDPDGLRRLCERGSVVIDCAGPFARLGRPVQDAALAARVHFLDVTGEQAYMRETFARDAEAKAVGVALINAVGFDVIPTDAAATLAAEAVGATDEIRIAFGSRGGRMTQGTARSMVESLHLGGLAYVDGEYRSEAVGQERWSVPFPEPMGLRTCISIPWGDLATAPRSTGAHTVRTFMVATPTMARMSGGINLVSKLFKMGWVRGLGERWVRSQPEGPSDEERARSSFAVHAEAKGKSGVKTVWVTGPGGYDLTAHSAVLCAKLAAAPGFAVFGAPTPSQAFGAKALLDGLAPIGVRWGLH